MRSPARIAADACGAPFFPGGHGLRADPGEAPFVRRKGAPFLRAPSSPAARHPGGSPVLSACLLQGRSVRVRPSWRPPSPPALPFAGIWPDKGAGHSLSGKPALAPVFALHHPAAGHPLPSSWQDAPVDRSCCVPCPVAAHPHLSRPPGLPHSGTSAPPLPKLKVVRSTSIFPAILAPLRKEKSFCEKKREHWSIPLFFA